MDKIKPEELRLGNWVKWPEEKEPNEVQWEHGHWLGVFEKNYGYPEPIPLTPEWLERFGWIQRDIEWSDKSVTTDAWSKGWHFIQFIDYEERKEIMYCGLTSEKKNYYVTSKVDYVHQLQNLYFALTGKELSLGPNQ